MDAKYQNPHIEDAQYAAKAFVSCSLRKEDEPFVEFVERILLHCQIKPMGTVGRHSIAPVPIVEQMKKNIPLADFLVVVATPRYVQRDMANSSKSLYGLSEMIHVEAGMAYMLGKPVVVFVKQGTAVGSFLPNVTQYITLDGTVRNLQEQGHQISQLLKNAVEQIRKAKETEDQKSFWRMVRNGLAIVGGIKVLDYMTREVED
ncbi:MULTISPECIES: hypothetical protein [unclassified Allomuricauda]|uniref:hypothetical protein n=1 Tax=unclassified Allomuricauda TaxID=2615049 RepID=UPI00056C59AE|nr:MULTISPECIES: hypothetical protein [unclassified Allomuricauda]